MPLHVVVDGSNIATEGRQMPSLRQLKEAVAAFVDEHPEALITIVVDATFGHRIDPSEVAEFDLDVSNNRIVAPPAGAVGRGDAFVLSIAKKVKATILTNDSYQEFHHEAPWLFEEGRLIGGKPVPHIGWVFVTRIPVRGPKSRKATADARRKEKGADSATVRVGSVEASLPMPVPKAPPPGKASKAGKPEKPEKPARPEKTDKTDKSDKRDKADKRAKDDKSRKGSKSEKQAKVDKPVPTAAMESPHVNDLLAFLSFVERYPVGATVQAVIDHYSSHGAYVKVDDVTCYLPLRLMASPAPRSAREFVKLGDSVPLVVHALVPARRSIDLATPSMAGGAEPAIAAEPTAPKKAAPKKAAPAKKVAAAKKAAPAKKAAAKKAAPVKAAPVKKAAPLKKAAPKKAAPVKKAASKKAAPVKKAAPAKKAAPVKKVAVKNVASKKV